MPLTFAVPSADALPLTVLSPSDVDTWLSQASDASAAWVRATGFSGAIGEAVLIPGASGAPVAALAGIGSERDRDRTRFVLAACVPHLKSGTYVLQPEGLTGLDLQSEALGWLLTGYAYDRYKAQSGAKAQLVAPDGVDAALVERLAAAEGLTRDLINTPANDMGPSALETMATDLARTFGATCDVTRGDALLSANFPMIHAVGRAASDAPRLIDMRWGQHGPTLTLVGKGVCFDTGGLNLKPGGSMALMKKDMGGAANVLGLAQMIMAADLPVRLRVLIPAVENSVAGASFRPGDILKSRKGLTVEINNTDAEGRLVLADALTLGDEETPDAMISMATLTGAARVAVGPDLAPFFTDAEDVATALINAAPRMADPVWRMPFWSPYEQMIEPGIADLDNAPGGGQAGAITAALFLRRFVTHAPRYAHFDIYGWQQRAAPGRSKGGLGQGARAIFAALPQVLGL